MLTPSISSFRFNFTIKEGNENNYFSLGLQSGLLSLLHPLTAGGRNDHFLLTIVAQNSQFSCHRGRVKIIVIIVRVGIEFPNLDPVSVKEDAEIGTEIARVEALGSGSGGIGTVTYSLASNGNGGGAFDINATTGAISIASELDFETVSMYTLIIIGTSDVIGNSSSTTLQVLVLDVNEPPFFASPSCAQKTPGGPGNCVFTVLENQANGTVVGTLIGQDPDSPFLLNGSISFNLVDNGAPVGFDVCQNGSLALILTTESFDREQAPSFSFLARVEDRGTPPLSCDVTVMVVIGDVNDNAPVFVQFPPNGVLRILESTSSGVVVADYIALDDDIGSNAEINYTLVSDNPAVNVSQIPFSLDPLTGVLVTAGTLDFEAVISYFVTVIASNPDGLQSNTSTLILILDVNDNTPIFSQDVYMASIRENDRPFTVVALVFATDADTGFNGRVVYSIEGGNVGNSFSITSSSSFGSIATEVSIDRETTPLFNMTIGATDLGSPALTGTASLLVSVIDENDNPPTFSRDIYETAIREDAQPMLLLSITAFDADQPQTNNSEIVFSLNQTTNIGGVFELVTLDGNTAALHLIGQLDFEEVPLYVLGVEASDRGNVPLFGEALVRVQVIDVNEFPPNVTGNQTIEVSEAESAGARIANVNVTDLNSMNLNFTIISVVSEGGVAGNSDFTLFNVSDEGVVVLNRQLDFEVSRVHVIVILVTDGQLSVETVLSVRVVDVNEFSPVVEPATFSVEEETPVGTFVGMVVATDNDASPGSVLTYRIIRNSLLSMGLAIDLRNGTITTSQILDREEIVAQDTSFPSDGMIRFVTVEVTDNGIPPISTTAMIGVSLEDVNDNPPVFTTTFPLNLVVPENGPVNQSVFSIMAVDRDVGTNAEIGYSVSVLNSPPNAPDPFFVDGQGNLRTAVVLDAEIISTYIVFLTALDVGQPSFSDVDSLVIVVKDLNDNAPMFSQESYEVSAPENVPVHGVLILVMASDDDITPLLSEIRFSLEGSDPSNSINLFSIDQFGFISTVGELDFESVPVHNLTIIAQDRGSPPLSSTAHVIIRLTNVDEVPPRFLSDCNFSVLEEVNLAPNDSLPIGECRAVDVNETTGADIFGALLVYEILDGNINDTFRIGNDGTVFLEHSVDREVLDFYSILIRVSDEAGLSTTMLVNVTIVDINDNSPIIDAQIVAPVVLVSFILPGENNFITVEATDGDTGMNAELSYSLGMVAMSPDGLSTDLEVTVSDNGIVQLSTMAVFTISFGVPCFLQDHMINSTNGQITSRLLCSVDIAPPTLAVAVGGALEIMCSALSNVQVEFEFRHNNTALMATGSGVLTIAMTTFESAGEYVCLASSEIGNLLSLAAVISVQGTC